MFFRFVLLGISFAVVLFIFDVLLAKIKLKYRLHKELKEKKKRHGVYFYSVIIFSTDFWLEK